MVYFDEEETPDIGSEAYLERIKQYTRPNQCDVRAICYYGYIECLKYLYETGYSFDIGQEYILYMLKNDQVKSLRFAVQHHFPMPSALLNSAIYFAAYQCVINCNLPIRTDSLYCASYIYFSDLANYRFKLIEKRLKIVKFLYEYHFPNDSRLIIVDCLKNEYNTFSYVFKDVPEQLIQDPFWRSLLFDRDLQDDNEFDRQIINLKEQIKACKNGFYLLAEEGKVSLDVVKYILFLYI